MDNSTNERSYEPHVVARIEPLLARYFAGEVETNGSNFGQMIERMKTYGFAAFPCMNPGCLHGIMQDGKDCQRCKGTGRRIDILSKSGDLIAYGAVQVSGKPERDFVMARCRCCAGTGQERLKGVFQLFGGEPVPCPDCNGDGYAAPVDAMPNPPSRTEGGYQMREDEMEFQATVNRVLRQVMVNSLLAYYVLSAYHGTIGDHWATFESGRIFALWPLTIPGRELIESHKSKTRNPHERLLEQTQQQVKAPQTHRANLIRQASEAARSLLKTSHKELAIADRTTGGRLESMAMRKNTKRAEQQIAVAV